MDQELRTEKLVPLYELGRGGMGSVELCEDRAARRLLAKKTILPELSRDPRARSMFLREARLLARIEHPNVVAMLEIDPGDDEHAPVLFMEFADGLPLRDLLGASPSGLPIPIAARLAHDVALGLHAAHEVKDDRGEPLGVVHRDVSPHNVIITFAGAVKLLDFGVAKTTEGTRTGTGEVKGKMAYMAPEQAMADPVDRRSDLYALGALLWEMLTGQRMHGEGTDLEILRRLATERPRPVSEVRPEVPAALSALVACMTAEAPADRPATAREVADALAPFAAGVDEATVAGWLDRTLPAARRALEARVASARDAQEQTQVGRPTSRPWWVAAVALLALGSTAAYFGLRERAPVPAPLATSSAPPMASAPPAPPPSAPVVDEPVPSGATVMPRPGGRPRPSLVLSAAPVAPPAASTTAAPKREIPIDRKPFD